MPKSHSELIEAHLADKAEAARRLLILRNRSAGLPIADYKEITSIIAMLMRVEPEMFDIPSGGEGQC